jgi:RNA polymerase sigma-70 factor (ECF subfamily)
MANSFPLMVEDGEDLPPKSVEFHPPSLVDDGGKLVAFTRLWSQHQSSVRAYLASFLGNSIAVDDGLQEVALVVWQKAPWDGDSSAFLGYCLACARRIALATRRQLGDHRMVCFSPDVAAALADRVALLEQQSATSTDGRAEALRKCLEPMKPEHRNLLEARYSGASKEELREFAKQVGKSMEALYKTLERLRQLLRECVERRNKTAESS